MVEREPKSIRKVIFSDEFEEYFKNLDVKVREKYSYVIHIIQTQYVVSEKFVKKLPPTELYEARITLGNNEYRTILIAVETSSFMEARRVVLLNLFVKKDTKQYKKEIEKAYSIIKKMEG
ncbi:phage-related protein [Parabacteroides sp. PFB2-10]|uniref:type II toxin-antitoxin system RelE/ParE family toxin n=1 Tax=Parabacteroides sp. PFB2-10 TaxID=1742405 RepID=UPI0024739BD4|nr:type II toxin-antitoxin system RelE/ParE family toxin [Parabacteroides sp. PFB2-10]MDH6312234.1 phage-related protein [Parabacteroides sp. PFB2-10]